MPFFLCEGGEQKGEQKSEMDDLTRLDRFLAQEGIGSRAEVKKMIRSGRIFVNREAAKKGEQKIDPGSDEILVDGARILRTVLPTIMLHKPSGVVSATQDSHFRTVIDLIDEPWAGKIFPVGRLDRDTEGLLLLTGDGQMAHELLSPKKHVVKTYYAVVSGAPDPGLAGRFREGLDIGEKNRTLPADLWFLTEEGLPGLPRGTESISREDLERCGENECRAVISVTEGKYHQIKRMFGAVGREVHYLKRIAMGSLALDPKLSPGMYRPLTNEELRLLREPSPEVEPD